MLALPAERQGLQRGVTDGLVGLHRLAHQVGAQPLVLPVDHVEVVQQEAATDRQQEAADDPERPARRRALGRPADRGALFGKGAAADGKGKQAEQLARAGEQVQEYVWGWNGKHGEPRVPRCRALGDFLITREKFPPISGGQTQGFGCIPFPGNTLQLVGKRGSPSRYLLAPVTVPAPTDPPPSADLATRAAAALKLFEELLADRGLLVHLDLELRRRLLETAGRVARPDPWQKREFLREARRQRKEQKRAEDDRKLAATGIRRLRREAVFTTPPPLPAPVPPGADIDAALAAPATAPAEPHVVRDTRTCYVCKVEFTTLHHFYDSMCHRCGDLNFAKRSQTADLRGRVAVVTGARVKIGYQASILMLRAGCRVIATTRFPHDAAQRYAREADFADWRDRLQVHGLDLRHTPSVEAFCRHLHGSLDRLDFVINNACQTVRRPAGFYRHLMDAERQPLSALPEAVRGLLRSHEALRLGHADADHALPATLDPLRHHDAPELSQHALLAEDLLHGEAIFPGGRLDQDLQQVDLRTHNSWRMPLASVTTVELLEVQLVNAVAPFVLNARLKPLMMRVATRDKHIVNVSAMEGQFYRSFKTDKHPHTNMAKAALNMMTRTSAKDYLAAGIHMNSVDTGWVTDEDPAEIAARKVEEHGFHPPL
ncbi:MAG: SDR family oxidoreductase, partial [Planctomycetes bacterium]|nr:SDR family oxidoreductase [Planctomycetota bacterium]